MASSTRHAVASSQAKIVAELHKLREALASDLRQLESPPPPLPDARVLEREIRTEEKQRYASILAGTLAERDAKLIVLEADATERLKLLDEATLRADELERRADALELECASFNRMLEEATERGDDLERQCIDFENERDIERQAGIAAQALADDLELRYEELYRYCTELEAELRLARRRATEVNATMDVFREGDPIVLVGAGWYDPETQEGNAAFRWVAREARLNAAQLTRSPYELVMDIEPGPAVGSKPFELAIYDGDAKLASVSIDGRKRVELPLPAAARPLVRELSLRAENAATAVAVPDDSREMAYRVFSMQLARKPGDVVHPAFAVGKGWYALESFSGETFRWAGSEATIEMGEHANGGTLALEVEPGPGVGSGPFNLKVSVGGQAPLTISVQARQRIEIPLGPGAGSVKLQAEGGGKRVASDPRILNFRAFSTID